MGWGPRSGELGGPRACLVLSSQPCPAAIEHPCLGVHVPGERGQGWALRLGPHGAGSRAAHPSPLLRQIQRPLGEEEEMEVDVMEEGQEEMEVDATEERKEEMEVDVGGGYGGG